MVLGFLEARLDITDMLDNVVIGIAFPEVTCRDEEVIMDGAELALEFRTIVPGCHGVDGDGVPVVFFCWI